jgi:hypothetical protein
VTTRIDGGHSPYAQQATEDAHAGDEHSATANVQQTHVSHVHMQRMKLRAKIQHSKAEHAGFYRNKRFATSRQKPQSASANKLLGQRPRAARSAKGEGKGEWANEWLEVGAHFEEEKHKQHEGHEGNEQRDPQQPDERNGQSQQQTPDNDNQQNRKRRNKPAKFAVKGTKATKAVSASALPNGLQSIVERHRDSPELPKMLAAAYTKEIVRLTSKIERGPLLAPLLVLDMVSRSMLTRKPARLLAQCNSALAYRGAAPGTTEATIGVLGQSLDMLLARQGLGIEYSDADQSLAMVKQRLLDATADHSTTVAKRDMVTSGNTQEIRVAAVTSGKNP